MQEEEEFQEFQRNPKFYLKNPGNEPTQEEFLRDIFSQNWQLLVKLLRKLF